MATEPLKLSEPQLQLMKQMKDRQSVSPHGKRLRVANNLVAKGLAVYLGSEFGIEYFGLTDKGREALRDGD